MTFYDLVWSLNFTKLCQSLWRINTLDSFLFSKLDDIWRSYKHCFYFYRIKLSAPPDCHGVMESGESTSGYYVIDPYGDRQRLITVYCDMETENGGWTVNIALSINRYLSFFLSFSLLLALSIRPTANPCLFFLLSFILFLSFFVFVNALVLGLNVWLVYIICLYHP